jgi:Cys-tRNA(Pro)/Cys-tRNA(Cys) deacylase
VAGHRTPATTALDTAGLHYAVHPYRAPGTGAYGTEAAEALGLDPARVFKSLVAEVDGTPVIAVVPVSGSLDLKALAAARGGKRAVMADPGAAQRLTGYVTGGISPLGTRRALPVVLDASALDLPTMFCSAGRRGLQLEVAPADLVTAAGADVADLAAG